MRIALLQASSSPLDVDTNLGALRAGAAEAVAAGAELILAPELFVTGHVPLLLADWLTQDRVADIPERIALIAAEQGIAVATGFPDLHPEGGFTISAGLWSASGEEVLRYAKVHLWGDEPGAFTASTVAPRVADWNGRRVAFQICYDIEFPEPARFLAAQGADLLLVPTAIEAGSEYVPMTTVPSRAAENALVVAYADHAFHADLPFAGLSTVAGREGRVLGRAGAGVELLVADIPDPAPVLAGEADYLRDRRPELYREWDSSTSR
ncbi:MULTISPECIES: nitrilase-related carbon-nitrogen hydrolase [unclassified Leucobacter]|uniref:nitrilase-related carbon-nitrogen hydrolase n=1 Tax=unclassified Leucobacter TaxID=2621730 RepID=UPI00165DF2F4|nr:MULTISPECIES: nitrilase-related carbon-nitrogen hydrolase [unclassified Leucobacter]MBC9936876.1 nitrilase [Leucobacter sp. cx-87]